MTNFNDQAQENPKLNYQTLRWAAQHCCGGLGLRGALAFGGKATVAPTAGRILFGGALQTRVWGEEIALKGSSSWRKFEAG